MTNTPYSLRPTLPADREFVYALFCALKIDELQAWNWDEAMRAMLLGGQFAAHERHFQTNFPNAGDSLIVVEDIPVGRLIVLREGEKLHLGDISLLPEYRGRGIGSRVIGDLQAEASRLGSPLQLLCAQTNPALRLYQRLGFVASSHNATHFLMTWHPSPLA